MINVILQSLVLDLANINVYAKVYQNIPNGLRVVGIFRKLSGIRKLSGDFGSISCARSCQYQCIYIILQPLANQCLKVYQNIPNGLRVVGIFRELSGTSQTVRGRTRAIIRHTESQPSASRPNMIRVVCRLWHDPASIWRPHIYFNHVLEKNTFDTCLS